MYLSIYLFMYFNYEVWKRFEEPAVMKRAPKVFIPPIPQQR